jgi:hypothetical protein
VTCSAAAEYERDEAQGGETQAQVTGCQAETDTLNAVIDVIQHWINPFVSVSFCPSGPTTSAQYPRDSGFDNPE